MAKNNLAGLAALGALGMMMSKGKKTEVEDRYGPGEGKPYKVQDRSGSSVDNAKETLKEMPSRGMPVKASDAIPSYLAKQANNPLAKPAITDVYQEDGSPAYKKNEFNEVYMPLTDKQQKTYQDRRDLVNANVNNPGYSAGMKKGGAVKMAKGGLASSASRRADGIASKGKTRGKIC